MTERQLCIYSGLDASTALRLHRLRLVPAWASIDRPQRGKWRLYASDAPLLCGVAAAFIRAGGAAVDAASLLATLRDLSPADRARLLRRAVIARWPGTCRLDWFASEEAVPRGAEVVARLDSRAREIA
jgi:hypothetical protein